MLLGIDIGTSGVKAGLVHPEEGVVREHLEAHDILAPRVGWAEQCPETWVEKAGRSVRAVLRGGEGVRAVSFSGQMHGIVLLDRAGEAIGNAIIWADGRSESEIAEAMAAVGEERFRSRTLNRLAAGFGLASLVWLKKHRPDVLGATHRVLCVKDYVRYRMCGEVAQDVSDASATCCMDVAAGRWADDLVAELGIDPAILPPLGKSTDLAGYVTADGAALFGLPAGTPVYFGGADQGVASIGAGIVRPGVFGSNIGTGGQVSACLDAPLHDPLYQTSTFIHAIPGRWTMFGGVLAAGLALKWLRGSFFPALSFEEMGAAAATAAPGCDGLFFLPYLAGERTPHFDPNARGVFWGLSLRHGAPELIRAVMEGVGFALRQCYEIMTEAGAVPARVVALGGGAKSPLWAQIQADMYGVPVEAASSGDACVGAAILAGVGAGVYAGVEDGAAALVRRSGTVYEPDSATHALYMERKELFAAIYTANKALFATASRRG